MSRAEFANRKKSPLQINGDFGRREIGKLADIRLFTLP
jgi:hypothetical protein